MTAKKEAKETIRFVDEYCEQLLPEKRKILARRYVNRKSYKKKDF